jgi:hypothetical protein
MEVKKLNNEWCTVCCQESAGTLGICDSWGFGDTRQWKVCENWDCAETIFRVMKLAMRGEVNEVS